MKQLRLPLLVLIGAFGTLHAQDDRQPPMPEIPDFTNLDDYIYEPKSTVSLGVRQLSGAKTTFRGTGTISGGNNPGPAVGDDVVRTYRDGVVNPDSRTTPNSDPSGNPNQPGGSGSSEPIADDDRTNSWSYLQDSQVTEMPGFVAFHSYSADVIDATPRSREAKAIPGLELVAARDMGKLFGSRVSWSLTGGMSLNDIQSNTTETVEARIKTLTDYYFLHGQVPPSAPYTSPSSGTETLPTGQTVVTDTSVLISDQPSARTETESTNSVDVSNRWKVKGSYFTFRFGPTFWIPITNRFRASVSVGGAVAYAGTNYTVTQSFSPDTGEPITDIVTSEEQQLLPGYYVDASLQFDLTERAGFYAGAVYQSTGSYTQQAQTATADYTTDIDLKGQTGLRAGMTIRF